jgi:hypothetical protein
VLGLKHGPQRSDLTTQRIPHRLDASGHTGRLEFSIICLRLALPPEALDQSPYPGIGRCPSFTLFILDVTGRKFYKFFTPIRQGGKSLRVQGRLKTLSDRDCNHRRLRHLGVGRGRFFSPDHKLCYGPGLHLAIQRPRLPQKLRVSASISCSTSNRRPVV